MARQIIDISRRQVLKGVGGATLALPILPSLLCRTAYGADPVFTRPPRLYWVTTEHTHLYGKVHAGTGEQVEQDVGSVVR